VIDMNMRTLAENAGLLQGSRQPSSAPSRAARALSSGRLWEQTGLDRIGAERVARGLGWFSIGLGLAELLTPSLVAHLCGGRARHTGLIRLYGLREIASGLMIFSGGRRPIQGVWSRVAGDAMDLATLAAAAASPRTNKTGVAFAATNVMAVMAVDVMCAQELSREAGQLTPEGATRAKRSITVNRPPEEVYAYWRNFENLPNFMYHLESVRAFGPTRSHWVAKGPGDKRVEWDSQVTEDRPNELIAWHTLPGSDVENGGTVSFERAPGGRGTVVRVTLEYHPPGGMAGRAVAALMNRAPEQQVLDDLRRFKQIMETGEILRSDGSPEGSGRVMQRPAQPMASGANP
jgi:uncharacterized membrane protein